MSGYTKSKFVSVKEEIDQARLFLEGVKSVFGNKIKNSDKGKNVFTKQLFSMIKNSIDEIEKIINMQEIDIDIFVLYKLRKSIEILKEKIDYINEIEKL